MVAASRQPVARTEELRLAMVMNGGVSLAVWMGGVSFEINRFVGETHPVYRQLLELTRTRARIDVISGTSAGGVNGAALALAQIHDKSLASLREVWLDRAAFVDLLRSPGDADPASVLDGDGYFLPMLREAFEGLTGDAPHSKFVAPMDLTLTTTLLRGELSQRLDSLGELVEDATHRGQFRFQRHPQVEHDSFDTPDIIERLSRAARSTASFPVAFEPVLAAADELCVNGRSPAAHPHFVIDGGVLDNKPIEGALRAIHSLPAQGQVRRVLAYVVPDPGVSAARGPDTAEKPPMMTEVALSSLMSIPGVESIADQLEHIDAHNRAVRRNRSLPVTLTSTMNRRYLTRFAFEMFDAYRAHRIGGLLDYVLDEIERFAEQRQSRAGNAAPAAGTTQVGVFGRTTRQWLRATWQRIDAEEQDRLWGASIPNQRTAFAFADEPSVFVWGLYTLQYLHSVLMDLLRRTLRLEHMRRRGEWTDGPVSLAEAPDAASDVADWENEDVTLRAIRAGANRAAASSEHLVADDELSALCSRTFELARKLRKAREKTTKRFYVNASLLIEPLARAVAEGASAKRQEVLAAAWLEQQFAEGGTSKDHLDMVAQHSEWATELVDIVLALLPLIDRVLQVGEQDELRPEEATEREALAALAAYLNEESDELMRDLRLDWTNRSRILLRLLAFEVIQYAISSRPSEVDSAVELVQISARQRSPLGGPGDPEKRLAGMQLGHFGAFYRKGWRANDWMMGRLDGIARTVRIALNPERLHRLYGGRDVRADGLKWHPADYVLSVLYKLCVVDAASGHRDYLEREWKAAEDRIRAELQFLGSAHARVPDALPASVEMLTRRLHLEVLCTETPQLAAAVAEDLDSGAESPQGRRLLGQLGVGLTLGQRASSVLRSLATVPKGTRGDAGTPPAAHRRGGAAWSLSPADAIALFNSCRIGSETLGEEVGTDLMLRTGSQSLYVAFAAATGERSGLGPISKLLSLLRWPVVTVHLLTSRIAQGSRADAAVTSSMLLVGALLAVLGTAWSDAPAAIGVVGWSLLFAWFATAYLRRTWVFVLGLAVVAAGFFLAAASMPAGVRDHAYEQIAGPVLILLILLFTLFLPRWVTSTLVVVGAAWWFSGMPAIEEVRGAACLAWGVPGCRTDDAAAGATFVSAAIALLLILVLGLLSSLTRTAKRR